MILLNRSATASARHHTYLLFSRLYLDGLTNDLLPFIAGIPELEAVAPRPFDQDQAAAIHYQVFIHDIFPHESIFRDPSGLIGGSYAEQVNAIYKQAAIHITANHDHIGHELAFLATLCSAESTILGDREIEALDQIHQLQKMFLQDHLLCWLSPFVAALAFSNEPFYSTLGRLTLSLVVDHFLSLCPEGSSEPIDCFDKNDLQELPQILQDNQTNLKQIAGFILTPPHSGLYFGQSSLSTMANERQLPRGFGNRQQMLTNLFHAAAQYDLIPDLLRDLSAHAETWGHKYERQLADFPEISTWIRPWLRRVNSTAVALSDMRKQLSIATI